jgi:hypothetical protein
MSAFWCWSPIINASIWVTERYMPAGTKKSAKITVSLAIQMLSDELL